MKACSAALAALTTIAAVAVTTAPAAEARVIDKGHFTEVIDSGPYDCGGVLTAADTGEIRINFRAVLRGSSPFPYYIENTRGTVTTTNLDTGGTFTQVFSGTSRDHTITDNGDGTITILVHSQGGFRAYDTNGDLVLRDPGGVWFSFAVDYNGTPGDPDDDTEVPDSFQVVRESTGRNDTQDRDFCEDVLLFTSP
jgi:hypothetical protein